MTNESALRALVATMIGLILAVNRFPLAWYIYVLIGLTFTPFFYVMSILRTNRVLLDEPWHLKEENEPMFDGRVRLRFVAIVLLVKTPFLFALGSMLVGRPPLGLPAAVGLILGLAQFAILAILASKGLTNRKW